MIAPPNLIEYRKLKEYSLKLGSFIRSIDNHILFNKNDDKGQILKELGALQKRIDTVINWMNAFEQNDLNDDEI